MKTEDKDKLIELQKEYIELLESEINEILENAYIHGSWKSTQYEEGKRLRDEIKRIN